MGMGTNLSGQGSDRFRVMGEINVTPLVDIMLVLLIIFMVAAPLMTQGVEVDLPDAEAKPLPSEVEPLVVSVKRDGSTYIEERPVSAQELAAKIKLIRGNNPNLLVYVRGDDQVSYGTIMTVMSQLQQAGVDKVGLVTEPER
ncbi:MAG: protein TolR [Magnetococcales bacterium]|nr:protein TolR [Magnetococcales bacterium]